MYMYMLYKLLENIITDIRSDFTDYSSTAKGWLSPKRLGDDI